MIVRVLGKVKKSIQISPNARGGAVIKKCTCSIQFNKYFSKCQHQARSCDIEKRRWLKAKKLTSESFKSSERNR